MKEREQARRGPESDDEGLTLVELLVAFAALMILLALVGTVTTAYLSAGTNVVSSYQATDQLLPSSIIIQRLIRSEVEPAPTPAISTSSSCAAANTPCPPFLTGSVGASSTTFYANIGDGNGPAKIVMAATTPTKCAGCKFYSSLFTVIQYPACPNPASNALPGCTTSTPICPFVVTSTATCTWSTSGKQLVNITGVVNPQTYLTNATPPTIFAYNTLDPYSAAYVAGTTTFASCQAPTLDVNGNPTSSNCPSDEIQSVSVDLQVDTPSTPIQENSFVVYRLSSASFLYSPLVG